MQELRCKTPAIDLQRTLGASVGVRLDPRHDRHGGARHKLRPRDLSFTGAVQTLLAIQRCLRTPSDHRAELLERLLTAIATHRIGDRPHRVEPRTIKRRPSKYPRLMKPRNLARFEAMRTKT
jgi:hypothetical protein